MAPSRQSIGFSKRLKSVQKVEPTDQLQVQLSSVKDGDFFNMSRPTQLIQQAASVQPGESQTLILDPVQPESLVTL